MKLYEVINPSDAATFYAPNLEIAVVAMLLLDGGRGAYGASAVDGTEDGPCLMFGGEEWLRDRGLWPVHEWVDAHKAELREALASVALGSAAERADFDDAIATIPETERAAFIARRNDRRRSSMNNFEARAYDLARGLADSPASIDQPDRRTRP